MRVSTRSRQRKGGNRESIPRYSITAMSYRRLVVAAMRLPDAPRNTNSEEAESE